MNNEFRKLGKESDTDDAMIYIDSHSFKVIDMTQYIVKAFFGEFWEKLRNKLSSEGRGSIPYSRSISSWFNEGMECELLVPGKKWQKGKVRIKISLEFAPDELEIEETPESESPLEDIRRQISQITQ
ncbi:KGK domain-containing protein [Calothrix sp. 336/3]|uniref:KGK domain-containing protein n=1 Tax=Calothrix sp. 336/3 TaxID=1337936 RepID=UPI0004E3003F|nr:KGK domain-containing protein [Calothrix sp. 336/3]AKG24295.1 hypothetical protein IJ00_25915 [Calothrix sp. 336/3]